MVRCNRKEKYEKEKDVELNRWGTFMGVPRSFHRARIPKNRDNGAMNDVAFNE